MCKKESEDGFLFTNSPYFVASAASKAALA